MRWLNQGKSMVKIILMSMLLIVFFTIPPAFSEKQGSITGVILISWDGVHQDDLDTLLSSGKLDNLSLLMKDGSRTSIAITDHYADTMAGHTEMLTGYPPDVTGVYNNLKYQEVPPGYTVFERINASARDIQTIMIVSKTHNLGVDQGLPFSNAGRVLDYYYAENADAEVIAQKAGSVLETTNNRDPFFAFIHFRDADEEGHLHKGGSNAYLDGIIRDDAGTGQILKTLESLGIRNTTPVFITTDHGFNSGRRTHHGDTDLWLISSENLTDAGGDQKDITPTILDRLGIPIQDISPALEGKSLLEK